MIRQKLQIIHEMLFGWWKLQKQMIEKQKEKIN